MTAYFSRGIRTVPRRSVGDRRHGRDDGGREARDGWLVGATMAPNRMDFLRGAVADCVLASTVMLGVAVKAEFLSPISAAAASATYGSSLLPVGKKAFIKSTIMAFQKREQAYVNLQFFIPFAQQLMKLRTALVS